VNPYLARRFEPAPVERMRLVKRSRWVQCNRNDITLASVNYYLP
jgi:hypothetical protein